jgi:hypothetical protein
MGFVRILVSRVFDIAEGFRRYQCRYYMDTAPNLLLRFRGSLKTQRFWLLPAASHVLPRGTLRKRVPVFTFNPFRVGKVLLTFREFHSRLSILQPFRLGVP